MKIHLINSLRYAAFMAAMLLIAPPAFATNATDTRVVQCKRSDGAVVDDAFCSGAGAKPDTTRVGASCPTPASSVVLYINNGAWSKTVDGVVVDSGTSNTNKPTVTTCNALGYNKLAFSGNDQTSNPATGPGQCSFERENINSAGANNSIFQLWAYGN